MRQRSRSVDDRLLQQIADPGSGEGAAWVGMRIHRFRNDALAELGCSSKLNAEWDFLSMLRDHGAPRPRPSRQARRGSRQALDVDFDRLLEGV